MDSKIADICSKMDQLPQLTCDLCSVDIAAWYHSFMNFREFKENLMGIILIRASDKKLLNSGRLIVYNDTEGKHLFSPGLLLKVSKGMNSSISGLVVLSVDDDAKYVVKEITSGQVCCILNKQVKGIDVGGVLSENETSSRGRNQRKYVTEEVGEKLDAQGLSCDIDLLLSSASSFITHDKLGKLDPDTVFRIQEYAQRFKDLAHPNVQCLKCKQFVNHFEIYRNRSKYEEDLNQIKYKVSTESLELLPEYNQRIEVLKRLNFLDEHLVLLPKGQIASCVSDNELLITEIVFENLLGNLSDEAIPAILSCFIFDNKGFKDPDMEHIKDIPELVEVHWVVYFSMHYFSFAIHLFRLLPK